MGQWQLTWYRFRRHRLALVGGILMLGLIVMAIIGPFISPETPLNWDYSKTNLAPELDWHYLFGTDVAGHSILMYILYGARTSLLVGLVAAAIASTIGTLVGSLAGYHGGWVDAVLMRSTDVVLVLPFLPLLILLSYYVASGSIWLIIVIFGFTGWPLMARLMRSYALSLRNHEFVDAARAVGVSDRGIIFRHILPNALSVIIVAFTLTVAAFIIGEAALDFLGVGLKPPTVSWGLALANSQSYFSSGNWWWAFFPGMALLITVLSINFLGDGLRDALDVRAPGL
jgi:ABC-type dipeptide/oligopeptide/nickel transport system permease subunit